MGEPGAVAALAPGKSANEPEDALEVKQQQGENGSRLDHDRVHLPVGVIQRNPHQCFGNAQMRR